MAQQHPAMVPSMQDLMVEHQKQWQSHLAMTGSNHNLNNQQMPQNSNNYNNYLAAQNSNTQQMMHNNNYNNNFSSVTNLNSIRSPQQFNKNTSYSAMNIHDYQRMQQVQQQPSQQQIMVQMNAQNHSQRSVFQQQARNNVNQNYYASTGQLGINNNNCNTNQQIQQLQEHVELAESIDCKHETFLPPIPQSKQQIEKYVNWQAKRKGIDEQKKIDAVIKNVKIEPKKMNFVFAKPLTNKNKSSVIIFESWLNKKGKFSKSMQLRYCKIYTNRKLAYFRDAKDKSAAGVINLCEVYTINVYLPKLNSSRSDLKDIIDATQIKRDGYPINIKSIAFYGSNNHYGFELVTNKRQWTFSCKRSNVFVKWIDNLRDLCFGKLLHYGYLMKVNAKHKSWKQRFCVLYDQNEIRYFEDDKLLVQKGVIELKKVVKILACATNNKYQYPNCIELYTSERVWVLSAERNEDRECWMNGIKNIMNRYRPII